MGARGYASPALREMFLMDGKTCFQPWKLWTEARGHGYSEI
jgi:hypothetical protein